MSLMQRRKGKVGERRFCAIITAAVPGTTAHRTSQADRAWNADIVVTGNATLARCWFECQDARHPNPRRKLEQAERDIANIPQAGTLHLLPVVLWHKLGEKTYWATMRLGTLDALKYGPIPAYADRGDQLVTMEIGEFLEVVA